MSQDPFASIAEPHPQSDPFSAIADAPPPPPSPPPNTVGGGMVRRSEDIVKGLGHTFFGAPTKDENILTSTPAYRIGKGIYQSGKEAVQQSREQFKEANKIPDGNSLIKFLERVRAATTGLSSIDPFASGSVTNINRLEDQGRSREAVGQSIPDILALLAGSKTAKDVVADTAKKARTAAIGDTDAAALKGLQVGAKSKQVAKATRSIQGARPYFEGVKSQADLQARVPVAKAEIWAPYKKAIDTVGDNVVEGPDGKTTVRELEAERTQLSAINRGLKKQLPEAIKLAEQKGLTQAQALVRERAVISALDPELAKTGIKPQLIRKTFGQVADIGERVSGKSTIIEDLKPYGFGKMTDIDVTKPLSLLTKLPGAARDIVAGRPLFQGKPTDIGIREGFRNAPPKPDLGSVR